LGSTRARSLVAPALAALSLACESPAASVQENDPVSLYEIPEQAGDGWPTASAETVGLSIEALDRLTQRISTTPRHQIHGILIARHGQLVFENYWPGWDLTPGTRTTAFREFDRTTRHYAASVSKSITSIVTGIAVEDGSIESVDATLFSFFPDYAHLESEAKSRMTVGTLLSFSSGLDWNEFVYGFDDPRDSHFQMFRAEDPLGFLLGREVVAEPGTTFIYNSGDTNLLGEIVRRATSSGSFLDFLDARLFGPLGITDYEWTGFGPGLTFASGGAYLLPRDMAKLGQLYLDGGSWQGQQIVTREWVDASVEVAVPVGDWQNELHHSYGFNWWLGQSRHDGRSVDFFHAMGWGGQDIFVYPELDAVVVLTRGGFFERLPHSTVFLLDNLILEAIVD
jgi:CubicO group peptidase (beta-lactamase class C family)